MGSSLALQGCLEALHLNCLSLCLARGSTNQLLGDTARAACSHLSALPLAQAPVFSLSRLLGLHTDSLFASPARVLCVCMAMARVCPSLLQPRRHLEAESPFQSYPRSSAIPRSLVT